MQLLINTVYIIWLNVYPIKSVLLEIVLLNWSITSSYFFTF